LIEYKNEMPIHPLTLKL